MKRNIPPDHPMRKELAVWTRLIVETEQKLDLYKAEKERVLGIIEND